MYSNGHLFRAGVGEEANPFHRRGDHASPRSSTSTPPVRETSRRYRDDLGLSDDEQSNDSNYSEDQYDPGDGDLSSRASLTLQQAMAPPRKKAAPANEEPKMPTPRKRKSEAGLGPATQPSPPSKKSRAGPTSTTKTPASRTRRAPESTAESLPIPKTIEEMTEPDQMIWAERKKGKGWAEINILWHSLTGQTPGSTTLPNRLTRIRENIGDFTPEDDRLMLKCKREIEETFSRELWAMTAEQMLVKGGTKFSANSVQGRCGEIEEEAKQSAGADDGVVIDAETGGAMITGNENAGPYHLRGQ